jgi:GntR family transcriptional regulator
LDFTMHHVLDVDPSAAAPIWRQIEDGMRRLVASGRLPAGAVVPSVRELAKALRVNPATVSKAYRRLTDAGLLMVRRGEGTFVADLSQINLDEERERLLEIGAAAFIRVAASVGASRSEAMRSVERGWTRETEGGEGASDDRYRCED